MRNRRGSALLQKWACRGKGFATIWLPYGFAILYVDLEPVLRNQAIFFKIVSVRQLYDSRNLVMCNRLYLKSSPRMRNVGCSNPDRDRQTCSDSSTSKRWTTSKNVMGPWK